MVVNTRRLFNWLLPALRINHVCDVGSLDGADALAFRTAVPHACILAFEANPENFGRMQTDATLRKERIQLVPLAVANVDGEAEFFVLKGDYSVRGALRGMGSLHRRRERSDYLLAPVVVKTTRLDTFFADRNPPDLRLALWIDVEGKAYEVIEGAAGVLERVHLIQVEVETRACIAEGQRCYPEVRALLASRGFVELATDGTADQIQLNALFVRQDLSAETRAEVDRYLELARIRLMITGTIRRLAARFNLEIPRFQRR